MRLQNLRTLTFAACCAIALLPAPANAAGIYDGMRAAISNAEKAQWSGNVAAAREEIEQAMAQADLQGGPNSPLAVRIKLTLLMHLGALEEKAQRFDLAEKAYQRALEFYKTAPPVQGIPETVWLLQLEDMYYRQGKDQAVVNMGRRALAGLQAEAGTERVRFRVMMRMMASLSRLDQPDDAADMGARAWDQLGRLPVVEAEAYTVFCRDYAVMLRKAGRASKADEVEAYGKDERADIFDRPSFQASRIDTVKSGVVDTSAKPPVVPSYVPSFVPNAPNCLLTYPRSGVVMELEGTVKVKFDVGDDGKLHHSTIVQSSGYQALDDATLGSMDRCAFRAAVRDGTSIPASFDAMFVWKLE